MSNNAGFISDDESVRIAGDWSDDDPAYVENLLQQHAQPPEPKEIPQTVVHEYVSPVKAETRMVAVTSGGNGPMPQPYMALPSDSKRHELVITSTVPIFISENKTLLPGPTQSAAAFESGYGMAFLVPANMVVRIQDFTGPVWFITAPNVAANPFTSSFLAVTE